MTTYAVQCQIETTTADGWTSSRQVPTFYLDANVQGIVDEAGAVEVARRIVNPLNDPAVTVHVSAGAV